ncbi:hypothetical protein P3X46_028411 [Hevea brasiliensis]|uniref:Pectinesterase inhibitor domain-containing protein n=1 Tax=Hevea brasiliensis TaxID=3981 RepID=A0ABQ9KNY2_HEVBR|nr:pectinesterase inhibitor-like [Hevea brasiliensis]KAJ9146101.1 hypothetical protein P3X46_028411 [Hevea brasiliensis]
MNSQSFIKVFTTIFLFLLFHFPSQTETLKPTTELLSDVCQNSDDKKFCIHSLKSEPRMASVKNLKSLAEIALARARKVSTETSSFFNSLQLSNGDHAKKEAIKECAKYFQETVGMLNLGGLEGDTASLDVHYALDNDQYCESALADAKVHAETISSAIEKWKNFYSVAYAAVVAVENSQLH